MARVGAGDEAAVGNSIDNGIVAGVGEVLRHVVTVSSGGKGLREEEGQIS